MSLIKTMKKPRRQSLTHTSTEFERRADPCVACGKKPKKSQFKVLFSGEKLVWYKVECVCGVSRTHVTKKDGVIDEPKPLPED